MKDPVMRAQSIRFTTRVLPSDHLVRNLCKQCTRKHGECKPELKEICIFAKGNPIKRHRWRGVVATAYPDRKKTSERLRRRQVNKVKKE